MGQIVHSVTFSGQNVEETIDISHLPKDLYYIQLQTNAQVYSLTLLKD